VYPVVLRVADLPPGVYHYANSDHSLELLRPGRFERELAAWTLQQPYVAEASVVFVLAGFPDRITPRYGERGYRYMLLEAGHIAQNFYLLGTAYGLGVLSNGGFVDAAINRLVGLNEVSEFALYTVVAGVLK
jgi:SagB-type dehydrogenase family enzyme